MCYWVTCGQALEWMHVSGWMREKGSGGRVYEWVRNGVHEVSGLTHAYIKSTWAARKRWRGRGQGKQRTCACGTMAANT
jgi:hypothetical protein